jgi:hypothetical protein
VVAFVRRECLPPGRKHQIGGIRSRRCRIEDPSVGQSQTGERREQDRTPDTGPRPIYNTAAATMTTKPTPPVHAPPNLPAAPMKFCGTVDVAAGAPPAGELVGARRVVCEVVPTAVGWWDVVLLA